jgi:hypothetical protein
MLSDNFSPTALGGGGGGKEPGHYALVQTEQVFNTLAVGAEGGRAVKPIHGHVQRPMRFAQVCRHEVRIV